ncbi:TrmH family RNA methyltransferase [Virgibacillus siamensis]|uniref:TrmH family RNA methyltransferase n=1 Tax=Virgibacillus siamensis TaxID=480071 RepID=UPI00098644D2|nr:RNA methyltransferase [Virgibacillus siamensis]
MITSVQNSKVKQWKKLGRRKEREKTGTFFIEGHHLIDEAYKSNWKIVEVIAVKEAGVPEWCHQITEYVSPEVFRHVSYTETPQGIAAVVEMKKMDRSEEKSVLLVDAIQDPGNLGTIIRTADAAGFDAVILGEGTVDPYNNKVIRSTQGSIFHLPVFHINIVHEIPKLKKQGFEVWASALNNAVSFETVSVPEKTALIVGNEGAGIQSEILHLTDSTVHIPIYGKAESLNVSVAAGILMYYIRR